MAKNRAPADGGINAFALKLFPPNSKKLVTLIFNKCLQMGHFPSRWERAEVFMTPKPNKPEANLASYRPISLLPVLSKILKYFLIKYCR